MQFILWDPKDGAPRRDDDGDFISDGVVGRITEDNVYLTAYAQFPVGAGLRPGPGVVKAAVEMEVGEVLWDLKYALSGSRGTYDLIRVA